jgi:hypothetical protein
MDEGGYREIERLAKKYGFGYDVKSGTRRCLVCGNSFCSHFDTVYRLVVKAGGTEKVVCALANTRK